LSKAQIFAGKLPSARGDSGPPRERGAAEHPKATRDSRASNKSSAAPSGGPAADQSDEESQSDSRSGEPAEAEGNSLEDLRPRFRGGSAGTCD